jgi:O-antigen ligase
VSTGRQDATRLENQCTMTDHRSAEYLWAKEKRHTYFSWTVMSFLSVGSFNPEVVPGEIGGLVVNQLILIPFMIALTNMSILNGSWRKIKKPFIFPLLLLSVVAPLSMLWSEHIFQTLTKGTVLLLLLFSLCHISRTLTPAEMMQGALVGVFGVLILSYVAVLIYPDVAGRGTAALSYDSWRGVFSQKNALGRAAMLGASLSFVVAFSFRRMYLLGFLTSALSFYMLVKSNSATAIVSCILFVPLYYTIFFTISARSQNVWASIISLLPLLFFLFLSQDYLISLFLDSTGKDATLTGRAPLWDFIIGAIERRPIFGYGVDGFFTGEGIEFILISELGWAPEHSHNGFLDLTLELGVVGLTLFAISLFNIVLRAPYRKKVNTDQSNMT